MLKPPRVTPGDLVGVVALSSPVRKEYVEAGVAELERLGFRTRLGRHIYEHTRYTAGSVDARLEDWRALWDDPDVSAIFCARGGHGSVDLLPRLSLEPLRERPKVVLGASDVTALHALLSGPASVMAFHGPMVAQQIARGSYDRASLLGVIGAPEPFGRFDVPTLETLHRGSAEGRVFGGCLSLVASLVGTPFLPSFRDSILFLEDTQTKPYQIDRMLTQLRLAGLLDGVRGIVFGEMPDCEQHPEQGYSLQQVLHDWTASLAVPVLFGFPCGHTRSPGVTLPLGVRARLDGDGLTLLEGAVS
jgi:muramoyltetrapeptide carboxypeptidase